MLTTITNRHHSKLPTLGAIGYLIAGHDRYGTPHYHGGTRQRYQVEAYPLNDNVSPYSIGIHTAYFRNLRTGSVIRMSGFYFDEV
jgi:hypothetical protein